MLRCGCCDLPVESCGRVIEEARRAEAATERSRLLALSGWFAAEFESKCARCGEWFQPGTPIHRVAAIGWACCE